MKNDKLEGLSKCNIAFYNKKTRTFRTHELAKLFKYKNNLSCVKKYLIELDFPCIDDKGGIKNMMDILSIAYPKRFFNEDKNMYKYFMHSLYSMHAKKAIFIDEEERIKHIVLDRKDCRVIGELLTKWRKHRSPENVFLICDVMTLKKHIKYNREHKLKVVLTNLYDTYNRAVVDGGTIKKDNDHLMYYLYTVLFKEYECSGENESIRDKVDQLDCDPLFEDEIIKQSKCNLNMIQQWFTNVFLKSLVNMSKNNNNFRYRMELSSNPGTYSFRKSEMLGVYNAFISSDRYITYNERKTYTRNKREWRIFMSELPNHSYIKIRKLNVEIDLNKML